MLIVVVGGGVAATVVPATVVAVVVIVLVVGTDMCGAIVVVGGCMLGIAVGTGDGCNVVATAVAGAGVVAHVRLVHSQINIDGVGGQSC